MLCVPMQYSIAFSSTFSCAIQSTALLVHLGRSSGTPPWAKRPYCFALKMRCIIGNCASVGSSANFQNVHILYLIVQIWATNWPSYSQQCFPSCAQILPNCAQFLAQTQLFMSSRCCQIVKCPKSMAFGVFLATLVALHSTLLNRSLGRSFKLA